VRKGLFSLSLIVCAFLAKAQGTLPFGATLTGTKEVPPNNDPTVGTGSFSLSGNSLSFFVNVPAVYFTSVNAYIQGPASLDSNAQVIFDLGGPGFQGGDDFGITPPSWMFSSPMFGPFGAGPFTLTGLQIDELKKGLWYANVTSYAMTNGQVRGQIILQPQATLSVSAATNNLLEIIVSEVSSLDYILQANTSLHSTNWVSIVTNTAPFTFNDVLSTNGPRRFYRAAYLP
jgi:hypothetical protein